MRTRSSQFLSPSIILVLCGCAFSTTATARVQSPESITPGTEGNQPQGDFAATPQTEAQRPIPDLSVEEVTKLVQAGLAEDLVIARIKKHGKAFDLTTEQLLQLKKAGVSDNIIRAMLDPQSERKPAGAPIPPPTPIPSQAGPVPENAPARQLAQPIDAPGLPDEQGVYWAKSGKELIRLEGKAVSNVRTGSTLASGLTAGIKRARINAQLKGARAETRIKERQPQFYFYLPEDASIGDYLLLKMAQRLDVRQIEVGQRTFWKSQSGIDHEKEIEFTPKRIKSRMYIVTPNREMEPGEYGFYVAAGVELKKPSGRIYDFGIDP